jgi:riboflavin kinase/FMN adenylyltransferase
MRKILRKIRMLVYWAVLMMPVVFPVYFLRFSVGGVPMTYVEVAVYIIFAVWVLSGGVNKKVVQRVMRDKVFWLTGLFLVAAVVSAFIVPKSFLKVDGTEIESFKVALGVLKGWVFMPILYAIMVKAHVESDREKKLLILALVASGFWLGLWAVWQVLTGGYLTLDQRASAMYESANYLALYLAPICVLCGVSLVSVFRRRFDYKSAISIVLSLMIFAAMFFTKSYAGYLAVFGGLGVWFLLSKNFTRKIKVWACGGLVLALVLAGLSQVGTEKFQTFLDFSERSSSSARMQIWNASVDMISEHPLVGIGLGQFEPQYQWKVADLYGMETYEWLMPHPHNFLLGIWLNFGLLGVLAMVAILVLAFRRVRSEISFIVACALVAVLIHGLFDMPFMKNDLAMEFWVLIVMMGEVISGRVVKGAGLGRKLGFPTINLDVEGESGVFLTRVFMDGVVYRGVMHRGEAFGRGYSCEIYLLDFEGDVYGKKVVVEVGRKIRDTKKFSDTEELKEQIAKDVATERIL